MRIRARKMQKRRKTVTDFRERLSAAFCGRSEGNTAKKWLKGVPRITESLGKTNEHNFGPT